MTRSLLLLAVLAGCAPSPGTERVVLVADDAEIEAVRAFVGTIGDARVEAATAEEADLDGAVAVRLVAAPTLGAEAYALAREDGGVRVDGGDRLGRLYGATAVLEALGYRFHHPHDTWKPDALALPDALPDEGVTVTPEVAERGLHLHTLHPTDGMFDFWVPSDVGRARAEAVIDWVVRNRGDALQWVALDDVLADEALRERWRAHTAAINAAADLRGVRTGLGVQLFGKSNLQLAFDLVDRATTIEGARAEMGPRLDAIAGLGFDRVQLSFGEFFGADPETFIATVELAYDEIVAREPAATVDTVLHVGDDLTVTYDGQTLLYYFLATYADRPLRQMVHSVMYFDLFEDAGGAYGHDAFTEHRELLLDRIAIGAPVGYYPESAYWVAFDDSVPQYLPLYVRSRWTDLRGIADATGSTSALPSHMLFSTGWEWGYWLHDTATLRAGWRLPDTPCDAIRFELVAHGDAGAAAAELVCRLVDVQHDALLGERLTPYLASYDSIIELGYQLGIVSQPRRRLFPELVALTGDDLAAYAADVDALGRYADALARLDGELAAVALGDDPWLAEVRDGFAIARVRAAFAHALADAALAKARGTDPSTPLGVADVARAEAATIVARRHAALHDPDPTRLLVRADNPTLYDYGYLLRADELCFWDRERAAAAVAIEGSGPPVPSCGL